ncbi:putative ABC transporter ATP-binding protein YxlF [Phycisphaerae bacterium RAS1]|nr:putative ABC transporter ATP-binding protein YxlF [Phycisphaerae bacterium RAS1]
MSESLLSLKNVRVQYGRFLAVDDLSLDLRGGDLLGMIGPNGAGKTTTLRAAAGLQAISTGSIHIMGNDVSRHSTAAGYHLGFTPDTPAVYEALTTRQFLEFVGDCYNLPRPLRRERIDYWLEQLWLIDKRDAKIGSLSKGMRQRLGVARTLLPDPHVILMDEPAAGLDPAGRVQFRQLLASLRDQGKAIIVSSHILADLAEYCTHIAIMEHGRFLRFGTVAQVTGSGDTAACTYRIVLVQRIGDIATRLAGVDGLRVIQGDGDQLIVEYGRERTDAARLLSMLMAAGLPVAEFRPMQADLEQVYLRSGVAQVD